MTKPILVVLASLMSLGVAFGQSQMSNPYVRPACTATVTTNCTPQVDSDGTAGRIPTWKKYALASIATGVNGCTNANGCWQVNGVRGADRAAALVQDVTLFQLPLRGYVSDIRVKTAVACTGATTALSGLGTASNNTFYQAQTYNIAAAVADANKVDAIAAPGSVTTAAENIVASLITTAGAQFVDTLAAGCAIDYWLLWATLP